MNSLFLQKLNTRFQLTDEEQNIMEHYLQPKKLLRKEHLLKMGDVCKFYAYVEKGVLRSYAVDNKGEEHIIQFALEGWIISDIYSFMSGNPAMYNIQALEDTDVILITKSVQEELFKKVPKYEAFTRLEITNAYYALQKRVIDMISLSLDERYADFITRYPNIVKRVPQRMIASYLGLKPETVSRIRKRAASSK